MNGVYKLVEIDDIPVMKKSSGKTTYPGRKQIFRSFGDGQVQADRLGLITDTPLITEKPLLELVVKEGQRLQPRETLSAIRQRTAASVASLPEQTRRLDNPVPVPIQISTALQDLTEVTLQRLN